MKPDEETIIDTFIEYGIFKKPENISKIKDGITTDWFESLSKTQQEIEMNKLGETWWDKYGNNKYNDHILCIAKSAMYINFPPKLYH